MKKNLLALSIAAMVGGIAGGANAQVTTDTTGASSQGRAAFSSAAFGNLAAATAPAAKLAVNTDGVGHILLVPYFTTQGDNASLLNIVNTDLVNGKAVKLRYRGAANSDDLFDITIYLSPGDVWTANVAVDADGVSRLVTDDKSCTLPSAADIKAAGGKFVTARVNKGLAAETREGYIEILNMADIPMNAAAGSLYTAIKHVNGVAPCGAVMAAQTETLTAGGANDPVARGYSWPTGGLFANWTIVNVADKASFSGEAVAVQAQTAAGANAAANLVFSPQTSAPIAKADAERLTADPLLAQAKIQAASYDFPDLSTPYTTGVPFGTTAAPADQATKLSDSLAVMSVSNEYLTNAAVSFATDWVFASPTRRYAVALDYAATGAAKIASNALVNRHFVPGTANTVPVGNVALNPAQDRLCVKSGAQTAWDREENTKTAGFVISPNTVPDLSFCGEASVLSFNNTEYSVLGASLARQNITTSYTDGWFRVTTTGLGNGLPVVGFAAAKTRGANMGGTWAHRYTK